MQHHLVSCSHLPALCSALRIMGAQPAAGLDSAAKPSTHNCVGSVLPAMLLQVMLGPGGKPLTSGTGLALATTPEGNPLLGPDGMHLTLAPDDETLLSWRGMPLLGPQVCGDDFALVCWWLCASALQCVIC